MAKLNFKKIASKAVSNIGGGAVGGAVSLAANKIIPASINPKLRDVLKLVILGGVLPELAPKSAFVGAVGAGACGQAGASLLAQFVPAMAENAAAATVDGIGADSAYVIDEDYKLSGLTDTINAMDDDSDAVME